MDYLLLHFSVILGSTDVKMNNDRTARRNVGRCRVPEPAVTLQIASSSSKIIFLALHEVVDPALSLLHVQNLSFSTDHREVFLAAPLYFELSADW